ncbi:hypothetical protein ACJJIP_06700 [Microbulbifer sp. VTAC004]|uniref:hypothetical protein n=1 Tax=Microbulbifer sp. VTAC004 TaxID=3243386 RepID=UPI0040396C12
MQTGTLQGSQAALGSAQERMGCEEQKNQNSDSVKSGTSVAGSWIGRLLGSQELEGIDGFLHHQKARYLGKA